MYRAASLCALLLAALAGCAAPGPALRHAVSLLGQVDAVSAEREAAMRSALAAAWRELAIAEHDAALRSGELSHDIAMQRLRETLAVLDRAREVIDGYAAESAAARDQAASVRASIAAALLELERRSAALDQLAGTAAVAAGRLGQMQGARDRREADAAMRDAEGGEE
jgi:hypothetical protein